MRADLLRKRQDVVVRRVMRTITAVALVVAVLSAVVPAMSWVRAMLE
jgi:hypothetical protein